MTWHITADELDEKVIAAMRSYGRHMLLGLDEILDGHEGRPLEQTINMCLTAAFLCGQRKGAVDRAACDKEPTWATRMPATPLPWQR